MIKLNRQDLYYLLGFGFLDYRIEKDVILLSKRPCFKRMIRDLSYKIYDADNTFEDQHKVNLPITQEEVVKFLGEHGALAPKRYLPSINDEYAWSFIAGYFDGYGDFSFKADNPRIFIHSPIRDVIDFVAKHWQVKTPHADKVLANGYKALDICGFMYKNVNPNLRDVQKFNDFMNILNIMPDKIHVAKTHTFEYVKLHPNAVEPSKTYVTDSGFDLHVIELNKLYGNVYKGKTGLAIKPILGYYFDIAGRSSLPDKGWQLLQGIGIVDCSYTGEIQGTFIKLNDEPMPKMPWKSMQLICRERPIHGEFVQRKDLGESFRAAGGFGSTDAVRKL